MRAINHALTGAIIGLTVSQPAVALPLAFLSHYVCDVIPHFGSDGDDGVLTKKWFAYSLLADAALCGMVVLALAVSQPQHWVVAAIAAFLATAPDFDWIRKYRAVRKGKPFTANRYEQFAADIQWFERPIGAVVEVMWFAAGLYLLYIFVV